MHYLVSVIHQRRSHSVEAKEGLPLVYPPGYTRQLRDRTPLSEMLENFQSCDRTDPGQRGTAIDDWRVTISLRTTAHLHSASASIHVE